MPLIIDYKPVVLVYALAISFALLVIVKAFFAKSPIRKLPGPAPHSWVLGNQVHIERSPAAECDFKWFREFGHTWRIKGGFSEDVLMTADPKALQFILQTSSYNFQKLPVFRERSRLLAGPGITSAEGNDHKRHRKVMLPAFALPEIKALAPIFHSKASKLVGYMNTLIVEGKERYVSTNVHRWLARATLDAIGEAAFDYKFGALDEENNALAKNFQSLMIATRAFSSSMKIATMNSLMFLPPTTARLARYIPTSGNRRTAESFDISTKTAKLLLDAKQSALGTEAERKDVMSLLVKSNSSVDKKTQLTDEEMTAQMITLMFAGHETVANSLAWTLYELAKHPDIQDKLRKEIRHWYQIARDRGEGYIPVSDYDQMHYTTSVMKETLRFHPIVNNIARCAARDLTVPLSHTIRTRDGEVIHEVPIKKGTRVVLSVAQYNRLPELWGPDFDEFKPERWSVQLENKVKFGVYGNLGTFGAGIHACIGWRFAVYEMQTFIIELINNFNVEPTDETAHIRRLYAGLMVPFVDLQGSRRETSMPLKVSLAL